MGIAQQKEQMFGRLRKDVIPKLLLLEPQSFVRTNQLGEMDFRDAVPTIEVIQALMRDLNTLDPVSIPLSNLREISMHVEGLLPAFEAITAFTLTHSNPQQIRDNLIDQLDHQYAECLSRIAPFLAVGKKDAVLEQSYAKAQEALKSFEQLKEDQKKNVDESRALLEESRKLSADVGIEVYGKFFSDQANSSSKQALPWLILSGSLGVAAIVAAVIMYNDATGTGFHMGVPAAVAKLILFTILLSFAFWTAKIYKAHTHNAVVNRHRALALSTFAAFTRAASGDDQTKAAVLLQATQAIFSHQDSGFLADSSDSAPSTQVLEIIRGIGSPK